MGPPAAGLPLNPSLEVNFHISNLGITFLLWACSPQTSSPTSPQQRVFPGRPRASHWQLAQDSAVSRDWRSLEGREEVCEVCFPPLRPLFWPFKCLYSLAPASQIFRPQLQAPIGGRGEELADRTQCPDSVSRLPPFSCCHGGMGNPGSPKSSAS